MQAVNHEQTQTLPLNEGLKISAEFIAYGIVILLALALRLASLGDAPMTDLEATQALAPYHVLNSYAAGSPQAPSSPMLFWLQLASFTGFGGTEFASRLPTVLASIALILLPLLFRARIGAERAFLVAVIFAFSPIATISARLADPVIFSIGFMLVFAWAAWRYWDSRSRKDALLVAGSLAALIFLGEASGLLFGLLGLLAGVITIAWEIIRAPYENDSVGDEILTAWRELWEKFPKLPALLTMAIVAVLGTTAFMLYPSAFNMLSELVASALRGFVQPSVQNAPPVFALLALFVYSPLLLIFGLVSAVMLLTNRSTWLDRLAIVFSLLSFVFLLIYQGTSPAYALWLVLPLAYLTARMVSALLLNVMPSFLSMDSYTSDNPNDYAWIKWIIAIVIVAACLMLSLNLAELGRVLRDYNDSQFMLLIGRTGWLIIMSLLVIVGFFLFASIWGNHTAYQGYGLGVFIFMLIIGTGTAWSVAVSNLSNPAELWYTTAVSPDAYKLRQSLIEISQRDTGGFPDIPVTILLDEAAGVTDDGLLAWLVRDFEQARFVNTMSDAARDEIVLLPVMEEDPDLEGSYVGQSFAIRLYNTNAYLSPMEWLSWFTQRSTRSNTPTRDTSILWLRIDVYDGIPVSERP